MSHNSTKDECNNYSGNYDIISEEPKNPKKTKYTPITSIRAKELIPDIADDRFFIERKDEHSVRIQSNTIRKIITKLKE